MTPLESTATYQTETLRAYLALGKVWESAGDYDKALDAYLTAWQKNMRSLEVEAALFREEFLLETFPRSVEELAVVGAQRESAPLWRLLARVCEAKADYGTATVFLTEALRVKPDDVASLSILARITERCQGRDAAEQWHRQILELNLILRLPNLFLAQQHYCRGEYEQAIPYFERLLLYEQLGCGRPGDRVFELYRLLACVKCGGPEGFEGRIARVQQWQDLTAEEQTLVRDLSALVGEESLRGRAQEGRDSYGDLASDLEATTCDLKDQPHAARADELPPGPPLQKEKRQKPRAHWRAVARGVGLGLVGLLVVADIVTSHRAGGRPQSPPTEKGTVAAVEEGWKLAAVLPPSSTEAETVAPVNEEPTLVPGPEPSPLPVTETAQSPQTTQAPQEKTMAPLAAGEEQTPVPHEVPKRAVPVAKPPQEASRRSTVAAVVELESRIASEGVREPNHSRAALRLEKITPKGAQENGTAVPEVKQKPTEALRNPRQEHPESAGVAAGVVPQPVAEVTVPAPEVIAKVESPTFPAAPPPVANPLSTLSAELPHASSFLTDERLFAHPPQRLWQAAVEVITHETDILRVGDAGRGILHGEVLRRELRPRVHALLRPYGHYLVRVTPGATADTSRVQVKILAFDWKTGRPVSGAEVLPARFFRKLEKQLDDLASSHP